MEEFMQAATKSVTSLSDDKPLSYGFFVFWSVAVWAVATLILRIWGQMFFIPESNLSMGASFLFSALFLPPLVYVLFRWQKVQHDQRGEALIYLTIPSMLLDVVTTYFFAQLFPNLPTSAACAFGAWLLWGYAIILITGACLPSRRST
jgi:NhaP-type Na+/H+ or K+/H+ antiporter